MATVTITVTVVVVVVVVVVAVAAAAAAAAAAVVVVRIWRNVISNDEGGSTKMTMAIDVLETDVEKAEGTTRRKGQNDAARGGG